MISPEWEYVEKPKLKNKTHKQKASRKMIKFKGQVLTVTDEERQFHDKDKEGNKLPTTTTHRVTNITMLVKEGTRSVPVLCKGFDLPTTFVLPKEGETWETPEITSYQSKFKPIPEIGIN